LLTLRVVQSLVACAYRKFLIFGLGLFGTGLAYVIYYFIVENLGAVAAAGITYIPPVVAMVIGVFLVGDTIHPIGYAAMILTDRTPDVRRRAQPLETYLRSGTSRRI
jgi:hypothetical protein